MNTLITLTGPTCSGKSHLQDMLTGAGHNMGTVITATTRAPRKGELDGVDYHFWDQPTFDSMRDQGKLIEWAEFSGAFYATPVASLQHAFERGNGLAVQVIEPQGLKLLHAAFAQRDDLQGCRLLPVFMDCGLDIVARRFMQRYRADLGDALARRPGDIEAITGYYERRLVSILTVEVDWRREALADQSRDRQIYAMIVDEFGSETQGQVIARILHSAF